MSTTLLLLVIGGTIVMVDLNVNGTGFVPDVLGFLVLAVAGARLAAQPVDDPDLRKSLRAAGAGLSAVAVISGIDWLAMVTRLRPGPDVATGPYAWFDAMMLAVSVAVGVAVLMVTSRWFADRSRGDSARRLRRAAHLVGWPWGAFALISLVSVAVFTATDASPVDVKSFLVIPLIMVLFAPLAYCAWVLLRVRRDIDS